MSFFRAAADRLPVPLAPSETSAIVKFQSSRSTGPWRILLHFFDVFLSLSTRKFHFSNFYGLLCPPSRFREMPPRFVPPGGHGPSPIDLNVLLRAKPSRREPLTPRSAARSRRTLRPRPSRRSIARKRQIGRAPGERLTTRRAEHREHNFFIASCTDSRGTHDHEDLERY